MNCPKYFNFKIKTNSTNIINKKLKNIFFLHRGGRQPPLVLRQPHLAAPWPRVAGPGSPKRIWLSWPWVAKIWASQPYVKKNYFSILYIFGLDLFYFFYFILKLTQMSANHVYAHHNIIY